MAKIKTFTEGDEVYLITDVHGDSVYNPYSTIDGKKVKGEIYKINPQQFNELNIDVDWENGSNNCYCAEDLILVSDYETSKKCNSIW